MGERGVHRGVSKLTAKKFMAAVELRLGAAIERVRGGVALLGGDAGAESGDGGEDERCDLDHFGDCLVVCR